MYTFRLSIFFAALFSYPLLLLADLNYKVQFFGLEDVRILNELKSHSDLIQLQNRPPASLNSLRYRIASDIPSLIKVLHAQGYYDASITSSIENENGEPDVYLFIHAGPRYLLESYEALTSNCSEKKQIEGCNWITPESLGLTLGKPALAGPIIEAETLLLMELANCGYPLATIEKRDVIVDVAKKTVRVSLCLDTGPLCRFGPITMIGVKEVEAKFIARKILWKEGDIYSERLVEETQKKLIDTDLFSSVLISHDDMLDATGELPMKIRFSESKHKSLNLGVSYATIDGFGASIGWANRNFRHMGELLSIDLSYCRVLTTGILSYMKPDFLRMDQNYLWQAEGQRENITVYMADTYSLQNLIERNFNKKIYGSLGLRGEYIHVHESIRNGRFTLLSLPFFFKYTGVSNILDPSAGMIFQYKAAPYQAVSHRKDQFFKHTLTTSFYAPLSAARRVVLAFRLQLGSLFGTALNHVPMNKLFFGGSDEDLRGYRYKTVSPLNSNNDPIGGRGALYFTFEPRFRLTKSIGFVTFFDIGNVTTKWYPEVTGQWFKSVGIGLRYFAFFGPLRLDVGFPLDRRSFDPRYRIYASIGQTF